MKKIVLLTACAGALLIAGCNPVLVKNYDNVPVMVSNGQALNLKQVEHAIYLGAAYKGWRCTTVAPGHIVATIDDGSIEAAADIYYSTSSYSIHYKDSRNFSYRDGKISPRYNRWADNLVEAINAALSQANAP